MKPIDKLRELLDREIGEADPYFKGVAICDEIECDYMRLPLDADNVTIHVGDICEMNGEQFKVRQLCTNGNCWWAVDGAGGFYIAELCRHVKPRTLEDVIEGAINAAFGNEAPFSAIVKKASDEIRELLVGDAK